MRCLRMDGKTKIIHDAIKRSIRPCPTDNASESCYHIDIFDHRECAYVDFDVRDIVRLEGTHNGKRAFITDLSCWVPANERTYGKAINMSQSIAFPTEVCTLKLTDKTTKDGLPKLRMMCNEGGRMRYESVPTRRYGYIIPYIKGNNIVGLKYERGTLPPLVRKSMKRRSMQY